MAKADRFEELDFEGLGFRVQGLGFRVYGLGFGVQGFRLRGSSVWV